MITGIDVLNKSGFKQVQNKRVGLLAHPASISSQITHTLDLLLANQIQVTRLFGPEHGLWGQAQDMVGVAPGRDPRTGIPITSLYGDSFATLEPTLADFDDIDVLICDLQDVGSRYYTFIYTMALCMKTAAKKGCKVLVLDRPNPINGVSVEGKILKNGFESFVGLYPLPIRHGMTIGEIALYLNEEEQIHCDLEVICMEGWNRAHYFDETGLPWVLPSPNMPTVDTAIVYPGMCLIEATELSEGRGTTRPFELVGAPFIDPDKLSEELTSYALEGVRFRPVYFHPQFQKHAGTDCGGVQIHITNRQTFRPIETGMAVIKAVHDLYPNDFKWRAKPYEFVKDIPAIDLLTGDDVFRKQIESGSSLKDICANWDGSDFLIRRKKHILY